MSLIEDQVYLQQELSRWTLNREELLISLRFSLRPSLLRSRGIWTHVPRTSLLRWPPFMGGAWETEHDRASEPGNRLAYNQFI